MAKSLLNCIFSGAGGAVYVRCSYIGKLCSAILKSQLGFPLLLNITMDSSRVPKIQLTANSALWFGSTVATGPAQLQILNRTRTVAGVQYRETRSSGISLVPGQDKLSLNVWILDGQSQVVKGLEYVSRILVCPSGTGDCNEDSSLLPPQYISTDRVSGLFRYADIPLVCPLDGRDVMVQISLVAIESVLTWFPVTCAPCRAGQSKTMGASGRAWWCASCSSEQYVIDPNNPSFGCKVCVLIYVSKIDVGVDQT